jgi:tetratricopeptide (TPR) repeat protein
MHLKENSSIYFVLLFVIIAFPTAGQTNISQYFDPTTIPLVNRAKLLKVEIKWNMDGKSQALLNESLNYFDEGKLSVSLSNIDSFLVRNYSQWVGHYYRGQILMRLGRFKESEFEFTSVTKINPSLIEAYLQLAEALEYQRDLPKAKEQLLKVTKIDSKYVYAYYKLGNLALLERQTGEALTYYKKCNKIDPEFPDAYMSTGIIVFMKDKKFDDAIALFNKSLKVDSTFSQAYFWRGMVNLEKNNKQECLLDWDRFIIRNPRNLYVKILHANLNTELGNYEAAFSEFRKTLQNVSINEDKFQGAQTLIDKRIDLQFAANYLVQKGYGLKEEAFFNLKAGFCLMAIGQYRKAIDYLEKADKMATSPAIYFLMAICLEHGGAHNSAFQYYTKTLEYDNDVFDAHKKRSIYLSEIKKWKAANADIEEMFRLQPNNLSAYRLRGLMESNQGKYKEAISDLTLFLNSDSTDVEALKTRAICLVMTQRSQAAINDYSRILRVDQSQQLREGLINDLLAARDTLNGLFLLKEYYLKYGTINSLIEITKILVAQKKYEEVSAEIKEAKEKIRSLEKNNGPIIRYDYRGFKSDLLLLEGSVAYQQEKYEDAISHLTASLKENPINLESRYLRAKCFIKVANNEKAIEDFSALKERNYKDSASLYSQLTTN